MDTRALIHVAVEARYRDSVDGGGLLLPDHARVIADLISADGAATLCHELGNVLVPMDAALDELAADIHRHRHKDAHAEEMLVRLAIGLHRLSALNEALRSRALGMSVTPPCP